MSCLLNGCKMPSIKMKAGVAAGCPCASRDSLIVMLGSTFFPSGKSMEVGLMLMPCQA